MSSGAQLGPRATHYMVSLPTSVTVGKITKEIAVTLLEQPTVWFDDKKAECRYLHHEGVVIVVMQESKHARCPNSAGPC